MAAHYIKKAILIVILSSSYYCGLGQGMFYPNLFNYPPVTGNNFVRTYIPQVPTNNPANISLSHQLTYPCFVNTDYYDGLGRSLQEVARCGQGSTSAYGGSDIVITHAYDNTGKETYRYLPFSEDNGTSTNSGKLKTMPTVLESQYSTLYPGDQPYSWTMYDNSPLNRVNASFPQGNSWVGTGTGVNYAYYSNGSSDIVPIWTVGPNNTDPPLTSTYYTNGTLFITETTDEDGNISWDYKDIDGKTILKKQKINSTIAQTAYVYDDFGHLRWTLPPEAFNQGILTATGTTLQSILNGLCFRNFYDKRGRLVEKQSPGAAVEFYVYDKYDRLVLTQNGNLRQCGSPEVDLPPVIIIISSSTAVLEATDAAYLPAAETDLPTETDLRASGETSAFAANASTNADNSGNSNDSTNSTDSSLFDYTTYAYDTIAYNGDNPDTSGNKDTSVLQNNYADYSYLTADYPGYVDTTVYGLAFSPTSADASSIIVGTIGKATSFGTGTFGSGTLSTGGPGWGFGPGGSGTSTGAGVVTPTVTEMSGQCSWLFTYYDVLDRPIMTGIYHPSSNWNRVAMQAVVDNAYFVTSSSQLLWYVCFDQFNDYPASFTDGSAWTKKYYDDYSNSAITSYLFNSGCNSELTGTAPYALLPTAASKQTRGALTGSQVMVMDPNNDLDHSIYTTPWLTKVNFYDFSQRTIQVQSQNHCNGIDVITNQFDFGGNLLCTALNSYNPMAAAITPATAIPFQNTTVVKSYVLDHHCGKPIRLSQSINGQPTQVLNSFTYDALGRVSDKNQNIADNYYSYNIRGWLTGINSNYFNNTAATNIFWHEDLMYDNLFGSGFSGYPMGSYSTCYNGNISQIVWQGLATTTSPVRAYRYRYDNMNRVINATFSQKNIPSSASFTNDLVDFTMSNVTYDQNGNIKTMNQMGENTTGSGPATVMIDKLNYGFPAYSNMLQGVSDIGSTITTNPDFKDDALNSLNDYTYDSCGNAVSDQNKNISSIYYSYFNKPEKVYINGNAICYVYDALGNRLVKIVNEPGVGITTTDYVGGFQYSNKQLQNISNEEGRCRPVVATTGSVNYVYDYFIKDHLQNVRSVVTSNPEPYVIGPATPFPLSFSSVTLPYGPTTPGPLPGVPVSNAYAYQASHELSNIDYEKSLFNNMDSVRAPKPGSTDSSDVYAATLVGSDPSRRIGTAKMEHVMPGDQFTLNANCYYDGGDDSVGMSSSDVVNSLIAAVAGGEANGFSGLEGSQASMLENAVSSPDFANAYSDLINAVYDSTKPAAFLNYLVMDDKMNIIEDQSAAMQITGDPGAWKSFGMTAAKLVQQSGYVLVFLSSFSTTHVSFDFPTFIHYVGAEIEEDHYYPFGLNIETSSVGPALVNNVKYNSKELQHNEFSGSTAGYITGLQWEDYGARMEDPQLGRWLGMDAKSDAAPSWSPYRYGFDNPVKNVDPNGQYEEDGHFWTVYLMATLMNYNNAYSVAYYAEDPDLDLRSNGELIRENNTWMDKKWQVQYHALTGGSSETETANSAQWAEEASTVGDYGHALHRLGDSYAHRVIHDESTMYPTGRGHALASLFGIDPDNISNRPGLYMQYVKKLADVMGQKIGYKGSVDLFPFYYIATTGTGDVARNSAILQTEIRIQEGQTSFNVPGNYGAAIGNYLSDRRKHGIATGNYHVTTHTIQKVETKNGKTTYGKVQTFTKVEAY